MTYIPTGEAGDAAIIDFATAKRGLTAAECHATKFPGVCKPTNQAALNIFFELQRQLNRVAKAKGLSLIAVDGDIGPGTLKLVNASGITAMTGVGCQGVALVADMLAAKAKAVADAAGMPATVAGPAPAKPPSFVTPSGALVNVAAPASASLIDSVKNLGTPMLAVLGIGVIGIGYLLLRKPKAKPAGTP
jgi:hypothetical protein